jgi:hypothetical protein
LLLGFIIIVLFVFDTDEFFLATLGDDDDDDDEFIASLVEDEPVVLEDGVDRFDGWTSIGRFVSIGAALLLSWLPLPLLWLSLDET